MKKQKLKNLFKLGILLLGIILLVTNCEKDYIITEQNIENHTFLSKVKQKNIAFDNFKTDTKLYQIFEQTLDKSQNTTIRKISNKSKTTSNNSPFSSKVTKYTLGHYTAYTIAVKNTTGDLSSFQNIIIEVDNVREASYLITYYPDETYQEFIRLGYIDNEADIDFSGNSKIEILYYKGKIPATTKVLSANKSNHKSSNLSQKSSDGGTCSYSCTILYTPPRNCTAGGNHTPEEINECEGSSSQKPSSEGAIQAYCFQYGCYDPEGGSDHDRGSSPEGATTGSSPFRPVPTPDGWTPENVCTRTDPINGDCTETEPYTPIISRPYMPPEEGFLYEEAEGNLFDDQIINQLTGKALCVYNKLKELSGGFKNAIQKFDGEFPVSHLKFEIDPNMSFNTKKAFTRAPKNYVIDIVLNGNSTKDASFQKRPNLLVAKTIIHEVIHAEMFRKLLSLANSNGSIDVSLVNQMLQQGDYPGMLDYYFRNGQDINSNWQHQQMAAHYRETIGRVLQEFDTGIAAPDNQQPSQLYMDLSWEGLIYSNITAWQEIMNDTEKIRIKNVISNYINSNLNQTCAE